VRFDRGGAGGGAGKKKSGKAPTKPNSGSFGMSPSAPPPTQKALPTPTSATQVAPVAPPPSLPPVLPVVPKPTHTWHGNECIGPLDFVQPVRNAGYVGGIPPLAPDVARLPQPPKQQRDLQVSTIMNMPGFSSTNLQGNKRIVKDATNGIHTFEADIIPLFYADSRVQFRYFSLHGRLYRVIPCEGNGLCYF